MKPLDSAAFLFEFTTTLFNKLETPLFHGFSEVEPAPYHRPKVADLAAGLDSVAMVTPLDREVYSVLPWAVAIERLKEADAEPLVIWALSMAVMMEELGCVVLEEFELN